MPLDSARNGHRAAWSPQLASLLLLASGSYDNAASTLYAARGCRRIPLSANSPTGLNLHGILDFCQHPRTNQDLSWLRFIAEARGNIGNRPYGGIVEAPLITNRAERSEAVRNADAVANLLAQGASGLRLSSWSSTQFKRHQHGLERRRP